MTVNGWDAFRTGFSCALRYRWVLLILFVVNLLSALLLAVLPAALSLASGLGHRPTAIHQAADGVDAWLVIETLMAQLSGAALETGGWPELARRVQQAMLLGLLTATALPLLAWLPATFLSGGVLLTYTEAPEPFRWRRFLWGCWHWFGVFLLLGVVQGVISTVLLVPAIGATMGAVALVDGWLAWIIVGLLVLFAIVWLALTECVRIAAVARRTRDIFYALGEAVRFVYQNFPAIAGLYALALILLGLLHVLYRWGLLPNLPLNWWPVVLVVQQAFILARLWARLVRLAGGVALVSQFAIRNSPIPVVSKAAR